MLAGQHDEWADGRRYLGLEVLAKARLVLIPIDATYTKEEPPTPDTAGTISA